MTVEAVLIQQPAIDFTALLAITHQALGHNIASAADASHRKMTDAEKFLSCLAALKDESAEITPKHLIHLSYSILVIGDPADVIDMIETAAMPFVRVDTTKPNFDLVILSGTLAQWRDAVASGATEGAAPNVRLGFTKILFLFDRLGLATVWKDYTKRQAPDRTGIYLDYKHA